MAIGYKVMEVEIIGCWNGIINVRSIGMVNSKYSSNNSSNN